MTTASSANSSSTLPSHNATEPAIEAENLVRRFGAVTALNSINLKIRKGEFFSLLGPSGCGKTTLLRLIAGLDFADSGSLRICGTDARDIPAHHRPVNTVFQSYALFPHLTVWDNVAFGLRMKKVPSPELRERVKRVMKLVEISDLGDRKPHQISGGQKQRVALARAVVNEPTVLLLDEPLGALDLKLRKQLQVELHQLQRRLGITFIYVTHDQEEALVMSDRIAVMNRGRIEQMGNSEALYERPRTRFVAQFLGSCNLLPGHIQQTSATDSVVTTAVGSLTLNEPLAKAVNGPVTLAIRPEKLLLNSGPGVNSFMAEVADKIYSGAETQFILHAGETVLTATQLNSKGHTNFGIGSCVRVQLPPESLIALND